MLTIFQKVVLSRLVNVKLPLLYVTIPLLLSENLNIYLMSVIMNFDQIFIILVYKISLVKLVKKVTGQIFITYVAIVSGQGVAKQSKGNVSN